MNPYTAPTSESDSLPPAPSVASFLVGVGGILFAILNAIAIGRELLVLPPMARTVPLLRVLPTRAFDAVMDLFGINHTMDHFTGRKRR